MSDGSNATREYAQLEVQAAVDYLCSHLPATAQSGYKVSLASLLSTRYAGHWHPTEPERGSAYRSLARSGSGSLSLDPLLVQAARDSSTPVSVLCTALSRSIPAERWTLWIDPGCVSLRVMDGGVTQFSLSAAEGSKAGIAAGIKEIWGKLPSSLTGVLPGGSAVGGANATQSATAASITESSVAAEFDALVLGASPSKRSKALAIVRPGSSPFVKRTATPPPPLPPLAFTIEESTSPYVPSFAAPATATTSSTSRCPTPTPPLPIPSSPLARVSSATSDTSGGDPFFRPSSRASDASAASGSSVASCSIFSHSSNESRSSSIGSFSTMASSVFPVTNADKTVVKATAGEMNAAAMFQFPGGLRSAPASPSKPRRNTGTSASAAGARHGHTLSTSSAISASSSSNGVSTAASAAGGHNRTRSSQSNIRISNTPGAVQDYSNGKVGVLGGGVLLGNGSGSGANRKKAGNNNSSSSRPSSAMSNTSSSSGADTTIAHQQRPRSKSRTPSSSSSVSGHGAGEQQQPLWFNQHQYHPMPAYNPMQHQHQGYQYPQHHQQQQGFAAPGMPQMAR